MSFCQGYVGHNSGYMSVQSKTLSLPLIVYWFDRDPSRGRRAEGNLLACDREHGILVYLRTDYSRRVRP